MSVNLEMTQNGASNPGPILVGRTAISQVFGIAELLTMIFLSCLPDGEEENWIDEWTLDISSDIQYPQPSEKVAPLLLTHVCQRWRSLALETPRLWTSLLLLFDGEVTKSMRFLNLRLDALLFWLERSRSLPFSIRCSLVGLDVVEMDPSLRSRSYSGEEYEVAQKIMKALHQHKCRWENVSVDLSEAGIPQFHDITDHSYPLLKTLELVLPLREVTEEHVDDKDLCISSAPSLQAVALSSPQEDDSVTLPHGMPPSLRSLCLAGIRLRIAQHAPGCQIRKLILDHVELSDIAISRFPTVLPQLQSLTITTGRFTAHRGINSNTIGGNIAVLNNLIALKVRTGSEMSFPLNRISAPHLELLAVEEEALQYFEESDVLDTAVLRFLDRCEAPIKVFYYASHRKACNNIPAMLEKLPNLRQLNVSYPVLSSAGMRMLEDPSVCPNLMAIRSDGDFSVGIASNGSPTQLDVPGVQQILRLIDRRCRKRRREVENVGDSGQSSSGDEGRAWLRWLAFPVRKMHFDELIADPLFCNAYVKFINTNTSEKDI